MKTICIWLINQMSIFTIIEPIVSIVSTKLVEEWELKPLAPLEPSLMIGRYGGRTFVHRTFFNSCVKRAKKMLITSSYFGKNLSCTFAQKLNKTKKGF